MKKLLVLLATSFLLFSCCNSAKKDECKDKKCCEMTEEQKADLAAWNDWDNQTDAKKAELVDKFKKCIDDKAASCKKDGEHQCSKDGEKKECCKKDGDKKECCKKELTEEQKAACADFKAKWDNWDNLTVDEKKALLDQKFECCKAKCEAKKECCKKDGEKGCCKKDGEKKECCDKK